MPVELELRVAIVDKFLPIDELAVGEFLGEFLGEFADKILFVPLFKTLVPFKTLALF